VLGRYTTGPCGCGYDVRTVKSTSAGVPGLEPRLAEPESAGLPITPYPMGFAARAHRAGFEDSGRAAPAPTIVIDVSAMIMNDIPCQDTGKRS
jgi:hypothetical protein